MSKKLYTSLLAAGIVAASVNAFATTASGTLTVSSSVSNNCTVTGNTINFGSYTSGQTSDLSASSVNIGFTCTSGAAYTFTLDGGQSGNTSARAMLGTNNANSLNYILSYNGSSSGNFVSGSGTGNGSINNFAVYGIIPANQTSAEDTYSDTVNIVATFS